jgi:hypothetical protein
LQQLVESHDQKQKNQQGGKNIRWFYSGRQGHPTFSEIALNADGK